MLLACYCRRLFLDVLRKYRQQHAGTRADPDDVFARQQRRNSQACGFVLLDNVITIAQHLDDSRRQIHFGDNFQT